MKRYLGSLAFAAGLLTIGMVIPVFAQGVHPHYVHALGDLRTADNLLQAPDSPTVTSDQQACDTEVRHAIRELSRAAHYDSKNYSYSPPPDVNTRAGRLHEIRRLIQGALTDIQQEEDNPAAANWRSVASGRLQTALQDINQALRDSGGER